MDKLAAVVTSETFWLCVFAGLYLLTHVAAWTKTPADDKAVAVIRKLLDLIAGNYGTARNASAKVEMVGQALRR